MTTSNLTYDVIFYDDYCMNRKGFQESYDYCQRYIATFNGTQFSYFDDYLGGKVAIVCNENGQEVYTENIFHHSIFNTHRF